MKNLTVIALLLCMALSLCACGGSETPATEAAVETTEAPVVETTEAAEEEAVIPDGMVQYTVTVVDEGGNPVAGAMVQLCKDSCIPGVTNESGVATFVMSEDDYKASMLTMPEGYAYPDETEEFYFDDGSYDLTIVLKAVA